MMLTNCKLFLRAIGIVAAVAGAPHALARAAVLRAVYGDEAADIVARAIAADDDDPAAASDRIARGSRGELIIPTALLLLAGGSSSATAVSDALATLREAPSVRDALLRAGAARTPPPDS